MLDVLDRGYVRLRKLHLNLIRDPRSGIGPIVRRHEPARGSCRQERTAHPGGRYSQLSRALAVHVDVDAGIVERLVVLQVAQRRYLGDFGAKFRGKGAIGAEVRAADVDFDGRRSAEVHDLRDDVRPFKGKLTTGKLVRQDFSQALFELLGADA